MSMDNSYDQFYQKLLTIYEVHRGKYKNNPNSNQMCCMWSTSNPPDVLEGTRPICEIEEAFDLAIDEDSAIELYDMNLDQATRKMMEMLIRQSTVPVDMGQ